MLLHRSYHSNGWDLGIIDQVVWNTAHGRWFAYSFRDMSYAGDHWQPVLLLLVPFAWIFRGPEFLLLTQAAVLGAAAIPLYFAAKALSGHAAFAWAVVVAFMFSLGVTQAVAFDFHAEAFTPFLAFSGLWALATRRPGYFVASSLAVLLVKEDAALLALSCAWIAAVAFGYRRCAIAVGGAAVAYAAVVNAWLIPHFRGNELNPLAERFGYLGGTATEIVSTMATHPALVIDQLATTSTLAAVFWVLLGVAFLPFLEPRLLPALLLVTLPPLLSQDQYQPNLQLHYMLIPSTVAILIAAVSIRKIRWPKHSNNVRAMAIVLTLASISLFMFRAPIPPSLAADWDRFRVDRHSRVSDSILAALPPGATVSAQSSFVAHLAERERIYQFPRVLDARFVVVDVHGPVPLDDLADGYQPCLWALPALGFDLVRQEDGISVWEKRRPSESVRSVPVACSGQRP